MNKKIPTKKISAKKKQTSQNSQNSQNSMWGGRFNDSPHQIMQQINSSINHDKILFEVDIKASIAHAQMLAQQKIISKNDANNITKGLKKIQQEIINGSFSFKHELEDIHMNIEARLKEIIGDAASRLHTARSRNDQVATDTRLWLRQQSIITEKNITKLIQALLKQAEKHVDTLMPGFTHLQVAQPITFAHHLLAYTEMFTRDLERLNDSKKRLNQCPLGAAALAGTSFPINRNYTAKALGFSEPMNNSMDAVSARDFILEFINIAEIHATHLSRLAEEIILWSSQAFNFIKLSDKFTTGSSIMPQKRNPDAAELIRAKTAIIIGNSVSMTTTMKALPLTYAKDMQEDKPILFSTTNALNLSQLAMIGMINDLKANKKEMLNALQNGFPTATDLADKLVKDLKMPFRQAHSISGQIVKLAEQQKCNLENLNLADIQKICPKIKNDIYKTLSPQSAVESRTSFGGTAPKQVKKALKKKQAWLNNYNKKSQKSQN